MIGSHEIGHGGIAADAKRHCLPSARGWVALVIGWIRDLGSEPEEVIGGATGART